MLSVREKGGGVSWYLRRIGGDQGHTECNRVSNTLRDSGLTWTLGAGELEEALCLPDGTARGALWKQVPADRGVVGAWNVSANSCLISRKGGDVGSKTYLPHPGTQRRWSRRCA